MTPAILASVIAYVLTGVCALCLIRRRHGNRRLRLVMALVGLMPVIQAVGLLKDKGLWLATLVNPVGDLVDLIVGALCLCAIYLLDIESRDRKKTDIRLRLVEQETSFQPPPAVTRELGRRAAGGYEIFSYSDRRGHLQKPGSFAASN